MLLSAPQSSSSCTCGSVRVGHTYVRAICMTCRLQHAATAAAAHPPPHNHLEPSLQLHWCQCRACHNTAHARSRLCLHGIQSKRRLAAASWTDHQQRCTTPKRREGVQCLDACAAAAAVEAASGVGGHECSQRRASWASSLHPFGDMQQHTAACAQCSCTFIIFIYFYKPVESSQSVHAATTTHHHHHLTHQ